MFIGKFLEHVAVNHFHEHAGVHSLFPVYQSAYKPRHSTETAFVSVLDEIFCEVDSSKFCTLVLVI